ncbi:MAG: hypothetical protein LBK42_03030 [Propionibacteriaceae bacterium]|jgi:hypothetical protein|nr:hypothetical protein [Propionibacteriaceae bacterium]
MRRIFASLAVAATIVALAWAAAPAQAASVAGRGDIAEVAVSPDLNCGLSLNGFGQAFVNGNGCGTVVASHGNISRPSSLPVGQPPAASSSWVVSSQVTGGSGSRSDPFTITTVVRAWGLVATQVDVFAADESYYQTTLTVANTAQQATNLVVYHLASCAGQSYGEWASGVTVGCRAATGSAYDSRAQGIQFSSVNASGLYGSSADLWSAVEARRLFANSAGSGAAGDGAIGLSWSTQLDALDALGNCPRGGRCSASFTMTTAFQRPVVEPQPQPEVVNPSANVGQPAQANPVAPVNQAPVNQVPTNQNPADDDAADPQEADPSPTPSPSPTLAKPGPLGAAASSATPTPVSPQGETGQSVGQRLLDSPWSYAAVGVLGLGGFASASVLRRHGRPE